MSPKQNKKLKDYYWLCNKYEIKECILNNKSYEELSKTPLINRFTSILMGIALLNGKISKKGG